MLVLPRISASSLPATWSSFSPSTKLVWSVCCESGLVASTGRPTQPLTSENVHFLEGRPPLFCLVLTWKALTSRGWAQVPTVHQLVPLPPPPSQCPVKNPPCHTCVPSRLKPIVSAPDPSSSRRAHGIHSGKILQTKRTSQTADQRTEERRRSEGVRRASEAWRGMAWRRPLGTCIRGPWMSERRHHYY